MRMTQSPRQRSEDQKIVEIRETSCCIVGGGPAGLMLAMLLAKKKVPVVLLEQHQNFDRDFRGDTVHPSTLELLEQLGWVDELLKKPHGKVSSLSLQLGDQHIKIADLRALDTRFPYIALIPQVDFLDFIREKASQFPDFHVEMGANVRSLVEENGTVRGVRFQGYDLAWREVHASLIVGADGRFSRIRQLGGFEVNKSAPPIDVLWFRLPRRPGDPQELPLFAAGPGHLLVVLSRTSDFQLGYVIPKGTFASQKVEGLETLRSNIARMQPILADRVSTLTDWKQIAVLSVESSRVTKWFRPGLLLIGDAAHVMSPVGGVGINYAMQDAVEAANLLAGPLAAGKLESQHLASVQSAREFPVKVIQFFQKMIQNRILAGVLTSKVAQPSLPLPLRILLKIPVLRSLLARIVAFGIRRVRIRD
jgi:2-polyprenyl-6-methoxyphenol hydroxylase-like FAD-dependent oxidoreductase